GWACRAMVGVEDGTPPGPRPWAHPRTRPARQPLLAQVDDLHAAVLLPPLRRVVRGDGLAFAVPHCHEPVRGSAKCRSKYWRTLSARCCDSTWFAWSAPTLSVWPSIWMRYVAYCGWASTVPSSSSCA